MQNLTETQAHPPTMSRTTPAFDAFNRLTVPNLSAYWIPEVMVRDEIRGTTYIVTGSYDGNESFVRSLERIVTRASNASSLEEMLHTPEEKPDDSAAKK